MERLKILLILLCLLINGCVTPPETISILRRTEIMDIFNEDEKTIILSFTKAGCSNWETAILLSEYKIKEPDGDFDGFCEYLKEENEKEFKEGRTVWIKRHLENFLKRAKRNYNLLKRFNE